MSEITKEELIAIIDASKKENLQYLDEILRIKNISDFDVSFIMSRLNLNPSVIALINSALELYDKNNEVKNSATYSDYLYRVVSYIESLEQTSDTLFDEFIDNERSIRKLRKLLYLIVKKASLLNEHKKQTLSENIQFTKIL